MSSIGHWSLIGLAGVTAFWGFWVLLDTITGTFGITLPALYLDQWDNLESYLAYRKEGNLWTWLFALHNEHQILVPRLLYMVDWFLVEGSNRFLVGVNFVSQGAVVVLIWSILRREIQNVWITITVVSTSIVFLFSASQLENFYWGFQVQFVNVFLFSSLSLYLMVKSASEGNADFFYGSVFFGVLASFSMSNGLLVWPLLLAVNKLYRRSWVWGLASAIVGGLMFFAYFSGHRAAESPREFPGDLNEVVSLIQFTLIYLGNPLGKVDLALAAAWGGFTLVLFLLLIGFAAYQKQRSASIVSLLFILLFILGTASATALGRYQNGLIQATSDRYSTPALLWVTLILVLLVVQMKKTEIRLIKPVILLSFLVPLFLFGIHVVKIQERYFDHYEVSHLHHKIALNALKQNTLDEVFLRYLHPDLMARKYALEAVFNESPFNAGYTPYAFGEAELRRTDDDRIKKVFVSPTTSVSGGEERFIVYGSLDNIEYPLGLLLHFKDESGDWIGSALTVKSFRHESPVSDMETSSGKTLFYGHLREYDLTQELELYIAANSYELVLNGVIDSKKMVFE